MPEKRADYNRRHYQKRKEKEKKLDQTAILAALKGKICEKCHFSNVKALDLYMKDFGDLKITDRHMLLLCKNLTVFCSNCARLREGENP